MPVAGYNPFAPLALRLPADYVGEKDNAVDRLIQTSAKGGEKANPLDQPLYRKVDVWMLAIELAHKRGLAIPDSSEGLERFVDGIVLQGDPDRITLLELLAVSHVAASEGSGTADVDENVLREIISDPRRIIDIANRYAAAGIEELLALADPSKGKPLWLLATGFYELAVDSVGPPQTEEAG